MAIGLTLPGAALAAQPSCYDLWYARNAIYDAKGYCFKTDLAQDVFDNSDCWTSSPKLTKKELAAIAAIKAAEQARHCKVN
ncbi:MAG: YARHG domain-containing protein [Sphingopyxis terrae]|nr:MAG: YARHG domain-containing protein [Sphingopyxis terrae]